MTVLTSTALYDILSKMGVTLPKNCIKATIEMGLDEFAVLTCECYIEGAPEFITETKQYTLTEKE